MPSAEEAFLAIVNQYQGVIRRVSRTYASASKDREEIFQEIIYQLWRSFGSYRAESSPVTWVYANLSDCLGQLNADLPS